MVGRMRGPDLEKLEIRERMKQILQLGAAVSRWADVTTGRLHRTLQLATECYEKGLDSREHIYAFQELCETIEIYRLWEWRVHDYAGFFEKIRTVLKKGAVIREDETPNSSDARNNLFTYYLAGRLLSSGVSVVTVDGCGLSVMSRGAPADITIFLDNCYIDIECKRPSNEGTFERNLWNACDQVGDVSRRNVGIVALDCSPFVPPIGPEGDQFAKKLSGGNIDERLAMYLLEKIPPNLSDKLPPRVVGLFVFMRLASFSAIVMKEPLSGLDEPPKAYFMPSDRTQLLVYPNIKSEMVGKFYGLSSRLKTSGNRKF